MGSNKSTNLAKVLWYYNLIYDTHVDKTKICCPFHGDINPSLLVDIVNGSWFCFGCQLSGDAVRFVELMENKYHGMNQLQANMQYQKILKSNKCSSIVIDTRKIQKMQKPKKELYDMAYDYYHGLRSVDWNNPEPGYEMEAYSYMSKRGYSAGTLNAARARVTYDKNYSIIFPMLDNGKFRGWVSRTMIPEIEKKRKYLYNEGFSRATTLVGNYGKQKYVIVVEGYMDRLRFMECGLYENVVAILGWKMSAQQERKLRDAGATDIISCLDNDECGRKGTMYLKSVFGPRNVLRWSYLKGIKDPGDMSPEQFQKMYNRTMGQYREKHE